jgi:hypothetical protein
MTKPDDIDQDAWDTGVRMAGGYLSWLNAGNSAGHLSEHAVAAMADTIARAIMSAKAEEREANVAELQSVADDPPSHDPGVCLDMAIRAIRNRP